MIHVGFYLQDVHAALAQRTLKDDDAENHFTVTIGVALHLPHHRASRYWITILSTWTITKSRAKCCNIYAQNLCTFSIPVLEVCRPYSVTFLNQ